MEPRLYRNQSAAHPRWRLGSTSSTNLPNSAL